MVALQRTLVGARPAPAVEVCRVGGCVSDRALELSEWSREPMLVGSLSPSGPGLGQRWMMVDPNPCQAAGLTLDQRIALGCLTLPSREVTVDPCDGLTLSEKIESGCVTVAEQRNCALGYFDPGPPPMSQWHQPGIPGCYERGDAFYQELGTECQSTLNLCIRECMPPEDWQMEAARGLFDAIFEVGATPSPGLHDHIALVWAFVLENLDAFRFAVCLGPELRADPLNPDEGPSIAEVEQCVLEKLLGVTRLPIVVVDFRSGEGMLRTAGAKHGTIRFPDVIEWDVAYSALTSNVGRVCLLIQQAGVLLHEIMHTCGTRHARSGPSPDTCEIQTVVSRNFMYLLSKRYECMRHQDCCVGVGDLPWGYDVGGIVQLSACN